MDYWSNLAAARGIIRRLENYHQAIIDEYEKSGDLTESIYQARAKFRETGADMAERLAGIERDILK